jgi:SRSO17 transposase
LSHIRRVLKAGFQLTAVVADADYGSTAAFRRGLEQLGLRYGVAIRWFLTMWTPGARRPQTAGEIAAQMPDAAWQRVRPAKSRGEWWLLCERPLADDERKFYLLNLDATAPLRELVMVVRSRWPIEQQYRELKNELGIDHFEGRSYRGWTHHTVLTAIAFTFLQLERMRADDEPRPTLPPVRLWVREIMAVLYVVNDRKLMNSNRLLPAESAAEKVTK